MGNHVFICYARKNQGFVLNLVDILKAQNVPVWIDQKNIPASADWDIAIDNALYDCAVFLIVLSPESINSKEVRGELRTALDEGKTILPVLYKECRVPRQLKLVQHIDYMGCEPSDKGKLDQVMRVLRENIPELEQTQDRVPDKSFRQKDSFRTLSSSSVSSVFEKTINGMAFCVDFSPDGKKIAIGSHYRIHLWNTNNWSQQKIIDAHQENVTDVVFSPDGTILASGSQDCTTKLWDTKDGSLLSSLDNRSLVEKATDGFWNGFASKYRVDRLAFSPQGDILVSGNDYNGFLRFWRLFDRKLIGNIESMEGGIMAFSPNGKTIACAGSNGLSMWRTEDRKKLYGSSVSPTQAEYFGAKDIEFSPDGSMIAVASRDTKIHFYRVSDLKYLHSFDGHEETVECIAFSPNGKSLASGSLDTTVRLWSIADQSPIQVLNENTENVYGVAFSPDGKLLVSVSGDNTVRGWQL